MGIRYELAPEIQREVEEIAKLIFPHVKLDSVVCIRSYGSSSRGTIARCHAMGKAMQIALGRRGFYVIEVISKRYDKMPEIEKTKTLIHELMHIPKSFGGGFIHHNIVHERNVQRMYDHYINMKTKSPDSNLNSFIDQDKKIDKIIDKKISDGERVEREFFVVLDKPRTENGIVVKKKRFWFN
jgi:predicted metallopeptidase